MGLCKKLTSHNSTPTAKFFEQKYAMFIYNTFSQYSMQGYCSSTYDVDNKEDVCIIC